jgi:hypothetical protein
LRGRKATAVRHTLGRIAFEIPDGLPDLSDYSYESRDRKTVLVVQQAGDDDPDDASALLAAARTRYEGTLGPTIIYSDPTTFVRGDGSPVPGAEGEQRDLNDPSKRLRFALVAIADRRGKAVLMYVGPAGPKSLALFRQILGTLSFVSDAGAQPRPPIAFTRRQAARLLFCAPDEWVGPVRLFFCSQIEIRVSIAEPMAKEGDIDLSEVAPADRVRVFDTKTRRIESSDRIGWAGTWHVADGADLKEVTIVHKASIELKGAGVVTLVAKGPASEAEPLRGTWDALDHSLRLDREVK